MAARVTPCPSCGTRNRVPVVAQGDPRCGKCSASLPWLVAASDADLAGALDAGRLVLVDLWAPWCGPCLQVAPVLERLAARYAGRLKVVKVNVDDNPQAAARFDARSIPTLVFWRDGAVVDRQVGAAGEHVLAGRIDALLASG